jgi:hypothetical protein
MNNQTNEQTQKKTINKTLKKGLFVEGKIQHCQMWC